jgi:hypothetical protein
MNAGPELDPAAVDAKWAEIGPLIDRMMQRVGDPTEFQVAARSPLAGDDKASNPAGREPAAKSPGRSLAFADEGDTVSRKPRVGAIVAVVAVAALAYQCGHNDDKRDDTKSESTPEAAAPTTPTVDAESHSTIPGNGTHNIGGMDGKDWGVYTATVPAGSTCQWSIRSVAPYRPGEILDEGRGAAGEVVRASIQPDGDVSTFTGEIDDDHRIVFMTNGCGAWSAE